MMWWSGSWSGSDWLWMSLMMVLFWGLIGVGVYWLVRSARGPAEHHHETPEDILAKRFAGGQISADEYAQAKKVLAGGDALRLGRPKKTA